MKERAIISIILLLIAYVVCGCEEESVDERFICPHCKQHTDFLLKPEPIVLERRVGAVVKVDYKICCNICDVEIDPNEASYKAWLGWE